MKEIWHKWNLILIKENMFLKNQHKEFSKLNAITKKNLIWLLNILPNLQIVSTLTECCGWNRRVQFVNELWTIEHFHKLLLFE